jgi:GNAT superfamily N-acetyltransferase
MTVLPERIEVTIDGGLIVRRARSYDLRSALDLLALLHDEADEPTNQNAQNLFDEILRDPRRALLVTDSAGELIGTLDLFVMDNLTHGGRPWAGVENIIVDPRFRRQGVARAMLGVAIDISRELGCYKVQLVSNDRRKPAHNLYRAMGFDAPVQGFRTYL